MKNHPDVAETSLSEPANHWTIKPQLQLFDDADFIMERLVSPAPRSIYVINQSVLRLHSTLKALQSNIEASNEYITKSINTETYLNEAENIKNEIQSLSYLVKRGFKTQLILTNMHDSSFQLKNDSSKPLVSWSVIAESETFLRQDSKPKSVLDLAHDAIALATESASWDLPKEQKTLDSIAFEAEVR